MKTMMKNKKVCVTACVAAGVIFALTAFLVCRSMISVANATQTMEGADTDWYTWSTSTYVIDTPEELLGVYALSQTTDFAGKTIQLGADITWNTGDAASWETTAPEKEWYPIQKFAGTFDGQNHTISGLYVNAAESGVGLFAETTADSVVKNLEITNSYFNCSVEAGTDALIGSVAGHGGGTFENIYSDAIVESNGYYSAGIIGKIDVDGTNEINNCQFDGALVMTGEEGRYGGGIVALVESDATIAHCFNSADISCEALRKSSHIGGIAGATKGEGTDLTLEDCLSSGAITFVNGNRVGNVVGYVEDATVLNINQVVGLYETYIKGVGYVNGTQNGVVSMKWEDTILGTEGYVETFLDFDNYWVAVKDSVPELKSFKQGQELDLTGIYQPDTKWYTEGTSPYTLNTVADLYGLYELSKTNDFAGETILLGADLYVNENDGSAADWAENAPRQDWNPINTFAGTFDGQGHIISGIYQNTGESRTGLFRHIATGAVVKNFKLLNSYFGYIGADNAYMGSVVGIIGGGTLEQIYSDAILESNGYRVGGLAGRIMTRATCTISNCWFDGELNMKGESGRHAAGIVGDVWGGSSVIEHCLMTGTITANAANAGSHIAGFAAKVFIAASAPEITTLTIRDSLSAGSITVVNKAQVGSMVGYIANGGKATFENAYATTECYTKAIGYLATEPVELYEGATWLTHPAGVQVGDVTVKAQAEMSDVKGYTGTKLDFDNYWSAVKNGTPELSDFVKGEEIDVEHFVAPDTSWYDAEATVKEYTITTLNAFYGFAELSQTTNFAGWTIKLGADIEANDTTAVEWWKSAENTWTPIGTKTNKFAGTFDGQGHEIKGIYVSMAADKVGLFCATTADSVIKDFELVESYFESTYDSSAYIGSVVGEGAGTFEDIYSNATVKAATYRIGGLIGHITSGANYIRNCWFDGDLIMTGDGRYAGGVVAEIQDATVTIEHCLSTADIYNEAAASKNLYIGGIVGRIFQKGSTAPSVTITDTLSAGTIDADGTLCVGAVVGGIDHGAMPDNNAYFTTGISSVAVGEHGSLTIGGTMSEWTAGNAIGTLNSSFWTAGSGSIPVLADFADRQ